MKGKLRRVLRQESDAAKMTGDVWKQQCIAISTRYWFYSQKCCWKHSWIHSVPRELWASSFRTASKLPHDSSLAQETTNQRGRAIWSSLAMTIVPVLATFAVGMQLVLKQRIRFGRVLSGSGEAWYVIISYSMGCKVFWSNVHDLRCSMFSFFSRCEDSQSNPILYRCSIWNWDWTNWT